MIILWSGGEGLDHRSTGGVNRGGQWAGQWAGQPAWLAGWHQGGEIVGRIPAGSHRLFVYHLPLSHSEEEVEPGDSFSEGVHGMHYLRS